MERASATLELPDGTQSCLGPGDIIGRMPSASLCIDDPRISEAHALVSLRGEKLKLLALRGALLLRGRPQSELELAPGAKVVLADGLLLKVVDVELPDTVLALSGVEHGPISLTASVYSLMLPPRGLPTVVPGFSPAAALHIWSTGHGWRFGKPGAAGRPLYPDAEIAPGVHSLSQRLARASAQNTVAAGGVSAPLRIQSRYDTVQIERRGWPSFHVGGRPARILAELVMIGAPANWEVVAREIWTDDADRDALRTRWDRNLSSLRGKLRAAGIRTDLVRSCGSGNVELLLHPGDEAEDLG